MTSAALVQAIPLLTAPIIARLYSPADFGAYAIFFGLVGIITSVATLALNNSILLEENETDAARATLLSISVSVLVSLVVLIIVWSVPNSVIISYLGEPVLDLLPWLPMTILVTSVYTSFYTWWIRESLYTRLGHNKVILGVSTAVIQIGIGLTGQTAIGFVWANFLGNSLALILLLNVVLRDMSRIDHGFSMASGWRLLVKHKALPIFTMPAGLINSISSYLPDYFINANFGASTVGQYSLANRMVNMPLAFVSISVQDIFRQEASNEFNKCGNCKDSFIKYFLLMLAVSILFLIPAILLLPYVFPIIFGSQWTETGTLIQPLIVLIVIRFISSPLSYVWIICGHQGLDMLWQIGLVVLAAASFIVPPIVLSEVSLVTMLWIYSIACGMWYAFCIFVSGCFAFRQ